MNKSDTILCIALCFTLTSIIIYNFNESSADTTDNEESKFLNSFGSKGTDDGHLSEINDVIINKNFMYIPDYENHRIQKFTSDGKFVLSWGLSGTGPRDLTNHIVSHKTLKETSM